MFPGVMLEIVGADGVVRAVEVTDMLSIEILGCDPVGVVPVEVLCS